jgi:hypothetical protein
VYRGSFFLSSLTTSFQFVSHEIGMVPSSGAEESSSFVVSVVALASAAASEVGDQTGFTCPPNTGFD